MQVQLTFTSFISLPLLSEQLTLISAAPTSIIPSLASTPSPH